MTTQTDTRTLVLSIRVEENEKLNALAKHFSTTQYGAIQEACQYLPQIEQLTFTEKLNRTGNSAKWISKCFKVSAEFYTALEDYATAHFRELANTIRYVINGCYKIVFNKE